MKDLPKAKQILRELISKSPTNDGYTTNAIDWLLYNSTDDNEFRGDLAMILESRQQNAHLEVLRESVKNWSATARQNKDFVAKAEIAAEELKKANADPMVTAWTEQRNNQYAPGQAIRDQMLQPATFNAMNDGAARTLLNTQSEWFRYYARETCAAKWFESTRSMPRGSQKTIKPRSGGWKRRPITENLQTARPLRIIF